MIIKFPGTKGEIEESSPAHRYHSSILISHGSTKVLIDFGLKHNPSLLKDINDCDALLITHAHPDHYIWTVAAEERIEIPVYLTRITLDYGKYRPRNYRIVKAGKEITIKDLSFTAYKVIHSIRCPAVGYGILADKNLVYAPDIVDFVQDKSVIFRNTDCFIGDGSSLDINLVRRRGESLFGHTRVKTLAGWCRKYGVRKLIVTHCGKQIVVMKTGDLEKKISSYSEDSKPEISVACDGMIENL